jgi:Spy/CpxP family protein refolding chaperone
MIRTIVPLILIILFGFLAFSQDSKPPILKFYEELNLTDEQKEKIESLWFEHQRRQVEIGAKLRKAEIELEELLWEDEPDRSAIERKIDEISRYRAELQKSRIEHRLNVARVLTPEQRKLIKEKLRFRAFRRRMSDFGFRPHPHRRHPGRHRP